MVKLTMYFLCNSVEQAKEFGEVTKSEFPTNDFPQLQSYNIDDTHSEKVGSAEITRRNDEKEVESQHSAPNI